MLSNISWASYWTALIVLLLLYYAGVLSLYYLHEIRHLLSGKGKWAAARMSSAESYTAEVVDNEVIELPAEVQSVSRELTAFLDQAKYAGSIKEEILFGTQQILKKYPDMKSSRYQEGLDKLLQLETQSRCAVHLSDEELRRVWLS